MPDYIKLQELSELRQALKIKELNEELLEHLQSSILYILEYCDRNQIPLPNMTRINDIVNRADSLIHILRNNGLPTKLNNQKKHPENEQESTLSSTIAL